MEMVETVEGGQNRRKLLKLVDGGEEDRISALPDGLILEILSRLPDTKYAIRTGALSKQWKHRWTSVTTLIFNLAENFPTPCYKNPNSRPDFGSAVDKTLTQCRQLKFKKFVMDACYDTRFESQVNNWIRYAISCNVEELTLMFWYTGEFGSAFQFDQLFFIGCFTDLTVEAIELNPIGAISWKNLRKLCLSHVELDEDKIQNILSGSPQLETLELVICCGFRLLNITSRSVKNLVFSGFSDPKCFVGEVFVRINQPTLIKE